MNSNDRIHRLLAEYSPMMEYIVRGILSDPHEAEECLAQVKARLWEVEGETLSFAPEVHLAGGMTAEEMNEDELWWYEHELDRLGHTQHYPWFQFSIPKGCTDLRGYLAHTVRVRPYDPENKVWLEPDGPMDYTATDYYVLRHQSRLLHYPFQPISDFGGSTSVSTRGVIHANFICTSSSITIAP